MGNIAEHIKRIPPSVWIGVLITIVVAIVITRWQGSQIARQAASGTAQAIGATGDANAAGAAQAAGSESITLSDIMAQNQRDTLTALNANQKQTDASLQANSDAMTQAIQQLESDLTSNQASLLAGLQSGFGQVIQTNSDQARAIQQSVSQSNASTASGIGAIAQAIQQMAAKMNVSQPQIVYSQNAPSPSGGNGGAGGPAPSNNGTVSYSGHTYNLTSDAGRSQLINDAQNNVVPSGPGGRYINDILRSHPPS